MAPRSLPSGSTLVAMAAGAALTLGAGGVALALGTVASADSSPSSAPTASSSPDGSRKGGWPGRDRAGKDGHQDGRAMRFGFGRTVVHGEFVVQDGTSAPRTLLGQRGQVTAISGSTVTVKSSDGFTVTWTVTSTTNGTLAGVAVGDEVMAKGTRTATGAATAEALGEVRVRPDRGSAPGPGRNHDRSHHRDGGRGTTPTPSSSAGTRT